MLFWKKQPCVLEYIFEYNECIIYNYILYIYILFIVKLIQQYKNIYCATRFYKGVLGISQYIRVHSYYFVIFIKSDFCNGPFIQNELYGINGNVGY